MPAAPAASGLLEPTIACSALQAGTLSGNPLAMISGLKTLEILDRPGTYEHLDKVTGRLIEGILKAGKDAGHAVCGGHISGDNLGRFSAGVTAFQACPGFIKDLPSAKCEPRCCAAGMFGFFFNEGPVNCFEDAAKSDTAKFGRWHRGMLEHGVYLAPSAYEAGFTSLAHTEEDVDRTIAAAQAVMKSL